MKAGAYGYNSASGSAYGYGAVTPYTYTDDGNVEHWNSAAKDIDGMMAVLGGNWYNLRAGDTVKVTVLHIPSGKTIFSKNVQVVG